MTAIVLTEREAGKTCPYCRFPLKEGTAGERCDACSTVHHQECWQDGGGCAVLGCPNAGSEESTRAIPRPPTRHREVVSVAEPTRPSARRDRRRWWITAVAAVVLVGGGAAAAAVVLTRHSAPSARVPLADQPRLRSHLIAISADQKVLNDLLGGLDGSTSQLSALRSAGQALHNDVDSAQRYTATLAPSDPSDRQTLDALRAALASERSYADAVAALPADSASLTTAVATEVVDRARQAQASFTVLSETSPDLPPVPVSARSSVALLSLRSTAPPSPPPPSSPPPVAPPPPPTPGSNWQTFVGNDFSVDYPGDWEVYTAEVDKGSYLDTTIKDPADQNFLLRVDVNPQAPPGLDANAQPVVADLESQPGYRLLAYEHTTFLGYDAVDWEFLVREHGVLLRKTDIFFIDQYSRGFAVLAEAPLADWSAWKPTFDSFFQSLSVS